jgi:hypothetical protein
MCTISEFFKSLQFVTTVVADSLVPVHGQLVLHHHHPLDLCQGHPQVALHPLELHARQVQHLRVCIVYDKTFAIFSVECLLEIYLKHGSLVVWS